jgi:hypothetical protein
LTKDAVTHTAQDGSHAKDEDANKAAANAKDFMLTVMSSKVWEVLCQRVLVKALYYGEECGLSEDEQEPPVEAGEGNDIVLYPTASIRRAVASLSLRCKSGLLVLAAQPCWAMAGKKGPKLATGG